MDSFQKACQFYWQRLLRIPIGAVSSPIPEVRELNILTVGLIAVGVWRNYNSVQDIISQEAGVIAALYRDVSFYPEPVRTTLQQGLREHIVFTIEKAWPNQKRGNLTDEGTLNLLEYQKTLYNFEPASIGQQLIHAEALKQFNQMITLRRQRIEAVVGGLPSVMWGIVVIGSVLSISVTYLLEIEIKTHYLLVGFLATYTGLVIFVIYGLDSPLSGPVSIGPTAYQLVLERLIHLH